MSACPPMPSLDYAPQPCEQCGAANLSQAEDRCTATQGRDGDYHCPGSSFDCKEADNGQFLFPTQESIARLDAWYGAHAECTGLQCEAALQPQGPK